MVSTGSRPPVIHLLMLPRWPCCARSLATFCCYGRRLRPDQGLIHRPTKTEVTAVVTLSVTQWVAVVAGTKWRAFVEQSGRKHARREARADL
jgi:hypothetical protein